MKRRDALKTTALFMGAAISAGTIATVMSGCQADPSPGWTPIGFSKDEDALITRIAEMIIPKTDVPGATDVLVNRFIDTAIHKVYSAEDKKAFMDGLPAINIASNTAHSKNFMDLNASQQTEVLQSLADASKKDDNHIFGKLKELTLVGFFTSEAGMKQALKYDPIPTEYNGCIDYASVGGMWAIDSGGW